MKQPYTEALFESRHAFTNSGSRNPQRAACRYKTARVCGLNENVESKAIHSFMTRFFADVLSVLLGTLPYLIHRWKDVTFASVACVGMNEHNARRIGQTLWYC
ncbi:MAG: hypothetical protein RXR52_10330 [Paraburkholderia sp.]|uniref:hypothetical protein n=1 Tax=Paraburkholderia sp. TaxID=1926495 RepID=UPI00397B8233